MIQMTGPPDFKPGYPSKGARISKAWRVAWDMLAPGGWIPSNDLVAAMGPPAEIKESTARGLLQQARQAGLVERRRSLAKHRPVEYRRTDVSPATDGRRKS